MTNNPQGYVIGYLENVDVGPEIFEYIERIEETFEPYGGRWLVHGSQHVTHEGSAPGNVVIIAFPSVDAVREWFDSEAYRAIAPLRIEHSDSTILTVEGVPDGYRAATTASKLRAETASN